jgi:hypothetical protein
MQSSAAYVERRTFSQKLTIGINLGLESALGPQAAGSVAFFVDPKIATKDPKKYWSNIDKMFKHNTQELKAKMIASICSNFGMDSKFSDFVQCVEAAKAKFLRDDLVDPSL